MTATDKQYDAAAQSCKEIFIKKTKDYGTSWRVLRIISVADQIFIKAQRIKNIQQIKKQLVGDDIASEFKGMVNYGAIGLIQIELKTESVQIRQEGKRVRVKKYIKTKVDLYDKVRNDPSSAKLLNSFDVNDFCFS